MLKGKIRAVVLDDAEMVLEWRNQDFVRNNMYTCEIIELEPHLKWFKKTLEDPTCRYFIYEQDNMPLGLLSFTDIDKKNSKASWAFYSARQNLRGVGSEMEKIALDYAFNTLNLNKLCCEVLDFNYSVVDFHRKHGFMIEGVKRNDYYRDGNYFDIYQLAILKDDYLLTEKIDKQSLPRSISKSWHSFNTREEIKIQLFNEIEKVIKDNYNSLSYDSEEIIYTVTKQLTPDTNYTIKACLKTQTHSTTIIAFEIYKNDTDELVAKIEYKLYENQVE